jgi:hypothetical protein
MTERQKQAEKTIQNPAGFKLCECCGSIVTLRSRSCLACSGYRFDMSIPNIIAQAKALALRDASSVAPGDLAA